jgi:hypothetical protein
MIDSGRLAASPASFAVRESALVGHSARIRAMDRLRRGAARRLICNVAINITNTKD